MSLSRTDTQVIASSKLSHLTLDQWHEFAGCHAASTVFHHRNWIEVLIEQYRLRSHIFAVKDGGEIVAAIPFLETKKAWGSKNLISLPFTDCVRILVRDDRALHLMAEALRSESFGSYKSVVLRTDKPPDGLAAVSTRVRHEMSTARPIEEIVNHFPSSLERNLRKADRSGLRFDRRTDARAMESFYRLHLATRKKHGIPIQPKSFFRRLQERLLESDLGFVGLVSKGSETIAGAVFLTYNQTMIYKYGASDTRRLGCRPNEFLFDKVIRLASDEGYTRLDLGICGKKDEGLRRFKGKWGSTESDVYDVYFAGSKRGRCNDSAAMRIASAVIRHSPTIVCRGLGEFFYRYSQ
jgi:CelD/BcsL family acetyltransferase involved in cellulose biosynthesis